VALARDTHADLGRESAVLIIRMSSVEAVPCGSLNPTRPARLSMPNSRLRRRGPKGTSAPSVISRCGTPSRPTAHDGVREGRSQVSVVCTELDGVMSGRHRFGNPADRPDRRPRYAEAVTPRSGWTGPGSADHATLRQQGFLLLAGLDNRELPKGPSSMPADRPTHPYQHAVRTPPTARADGEQAVSLPDYRTNGRRPA
jgi:hypothetical protein